MSTMHLRLAISRATPRLRASVLSINRASFSDSTNITYSGGHASEGQGGYYGSGGARHIPHLPGETERQGIVALTEDVKKLAHIMKELETLESLLQRELEENRGEVSGKSIEISSGIKKLMTSDDVMLCMSRLEHDGEPTWGLSMAERDLVLEARSKINEC